MTCEACVARVQRAIASVGGVASAAVDLESALAIVVVAPSINGESAWREEIIAAVEATGKTAVHKH